MRPTKFWVLALWLPGLALAQLAANNPDWKESEVPPPPVLDTRHLVPFEVSAASSLRFGVDPASIKITPDGIVRYVVVASNNSGAFNAIYEGVRCATWEFKVYARYNPSSGWKAPQESEWRPLGVGAVSQFSYQLARQGMCAGGNAPQASVDMILRTLKGTLNQSNN